MHKRTDLLKILEGVRDQMDRALLLKHFDEVHTTGSVKITATRGDKIVQELFHDNLVVSLGRTSLAHLLGGDVTNYSVSFLKVGTGTTAPVTGNTALETSVAGSWSPTTVTYSGQDVKFTVVIPAGAPAGQPYNLTEAGLFNNKGSSNDLVSRIVHAIVIKDSTISLTYEWTIKF